MTKSEKIRILYDRGHERELWKLVLGISPHNRKEAIVPSVVPEDIETLKLFGAARSHLHFIANFGRDKSHVIDGDTHYFSHPEKFNEWLMRDAPGVLEEDVDRLCESVRE